MKPLHDQARRVILEARSAEASARGSQARNWQALVSRLDVPLPPRAAAVNRSLSAPAAGSAWTHALLKFTLWGVLLGGFGGGLAVYGKGHRARTDVTAPAPQPQPIVELAPPLTATATATATVATDASTADRAARPARPATRLRRAPPSAAGLAAETRLIAQAQSKLSDGAPARALALLDRHRNEFPHGQLVPEREAARVLALCALGRGIEANAARARFERDFSSSPLLGRVRAGCSTE